LPSTVFTILGFGLIMFLPIFLKRTILREKMNNPNSLDADKKSDLIPLNKIPIPIKTMRTYGFFYIGYKHNLYYWEFIKVYLRIVIVWIVNYYESDVSIKGSLILCVLMIYLIVVRHYKPYASRKLSELD
jgi:hypothetical protein